MAGISETDLAKAATDPNSVTVDGVNVRAPSTAEVIAMDKHLRSVAAAKSSAFPLRNFRIVPPGCTTPKEE